ncbi:MAG: hypothetical protein A2277_12780 [Desulfobacterales bacterium RIFOXYA12_FULL_46_15]|nr:MAG: hypothetical protein A2097_04165 [Desulfobacula sp. GWF2_41_7]OGR22137.1 MAG: hypothetical protein A2277_12780 [Desulfobacterales bacterium RIFOXYA12_FULL_46_15]
MELLILKSGPDYIRIKDGAFIRAGLDKASVFPMDRICLVQEHAENMKNMGFDRISIKKLILTEGDL